MHTMSHKPHLHLFYPICASPILLACVCHFSCDLTVIHLAQNRVFLPSITYKTHPLSRASTSNSIIATCAATSPYFQVSIEPSLGLGSFASVGIASSVVT